MTGIHFWKCSHPNCDQRTARGSDMLLFEKVNHSTPRIRDLSFMFLFFIIETGAKKMWPANEKSKYMKIDTLKNKCLKLRQDRRTFYWIKFLVKIFLLLFHQSHFLRNSPYLLQNACHFTLFRFQNKPYMPYLILTK